MSDSLIPDDVDEQTGTVLEIAVEALDDMKAVDVRVIDVRGLTTITDFMIVASGTSTRHVKSIADNVALQAKQAGIRSLGTEGERAAEWILVDLADAVVHVMLPETREFFALEKLWSVGAPESSSTADSDA